VAARILDSRDEDASPYFRVIGFRIDEIGVGTSSCSAIPGPWLDELTVAGLPTAVLGFADAALGTSVATVADGKMPVTISLHADFLADQPVGPLSCASSVSHRADGVGLTRGSVEAGGTTVGLVTLRSMFITPRPAGPPSSHGAAGPVERSGTPAAGVLGTALAVACGARIAGGDDRSVKVALVPPPEFGRTYGMVHGGATAAIGTLGIAVARAQSLAAGTRWRHLDARIEFLREIPLGHRVEVRAWARHRGRRLAVFEAEVVDDGGHPLATARETVLIQD